MSIKNQKIMNTLIIEPNNKLDYQLFVSLAKRLNVKFREEKSVIKQQEKLEKEKEFFALAGSLDLPESAEEIVKIIESSRTTKEMDTSWVE